MSDVTPTLIFKAIDCCTSGVCKGCPYIAFHDCKDWLKTDVSAMIRVNTNPLTENMLRLSGAVWLEDHDKKKVIPALVQSYSSQNGGKMTFVTGAMSVVTANLEEYGRRWRAWGNEPTKEDRECAPWEMIP